MVRRRDGAASGADGAGIARRPRRANASQKRERRADEIRAGIVVMSRVAPRHPNRIAGDNDECAVGVIEHIRLPARSERKATHHGPDDRLDRGSHEPSGIEPKVAVTSGGPSSEERSEGDGMSGTNPKTEEDVDRNPGRSVIAGGLRLGVVRTTVLLISGEIM